MSTEIQRTPPTGMELIAELVRKNTDPTAAVALAEKIVELETKREGLRQSYERFEWEKLDRQAKVAFAEAFEQFKKDAPKILKTKHVEFANKGGGKTDYWHTELDKACDLLIPALLKVDITHDWDSVDLPGNYTRTTCILRHRLGYEKRGATLSGPADQSGGKNPIQGVGSAFTYLQRYTLLATCGIVPTGVDNDGNPPGMSQDEGGNFIEAIRAAGTAQTVMAAWSQALDAAKKMEPIDYRSMTLFTEARDERLKELKRAK